MTFYTFRELRDDARKAVKEQFEQGAKELRGEVKKELDTFQSQVLGSVEGQHELDEKFDPDNMEER